MICVLIFYILSYIYAKICLLSSCLEALPLLWCIKARPQNTILSDEFLSLALTILHVARLNLGWLGMYCPCSVREMGDWYGLKIRFKICLWFFFSVVNFLLPSYLLCDLEFTGFFSPLTHTGAFTLTQWLMVSIRYHKSIGVSTWGCIDTEIIDPEIKAGDPEGIGVAESRAPCF